MGPVFGHQKIWGTVLGICFIVSGAHASSFVFSDWDDTIVESRPEHNGSYQGRYLIFKNRYRATNLSPVPDGKNVILLTSAEFRQVRRYLAQGQNVPGDLLNEFTTQEGVSFYPGDYQILDPWSYDFFRPNPEGEGFALQSFREAYETDPEMNWKGIFFDSMIQILNDPEAAKHFGVITGRGHNPDEWQQFFEFLKSEGMIRYLPRAELFHNMARSEYDVLSLDANVVKQKVGILERIARAIKDIPLKDEKDLRLNPEGTAIEKMHSLTYVEDKPEIAAAVFRLFQRLAMSRQFPIKYTLILASTEEEMRRLERHLGFRPPREMVFSRYGDVRQATEAEITGELLKKAHVSEAKVFDPKTCRDFLRFL